MALKIMKFIRPFLLLCALSGLWNASLHAELIWEEGTGWRAKGGLLDPLLGEELEAGNARELMNLAKRRQDEGRYFRALRLYGEVADEYAGSIYAPEALFQKALIYIERHQYEDAHDALQDIIEHYPDYEKFNRVIAQQFEIAAQLKEGKRPHYWGIIPGFRDRNASIEYFEDVVKNAPYSPQAPVALMHIALVSQEEGKTQEAIDALDRLVTHYPDSILASDAYLNLANTFASLVDGAYYDQGSTREAINYYQDFLVLYPKDPNVATAETGLAKMRDTLARSKFLIGKFYWKYRANPTAAKIFLNDAITLAPNSPAAQEAQTLLDKIAGGAQPPKTPVDWLFGREDRTILDTQVSEKPLANTPAGRDPQESSNPATAEPGWTQ